jgi:hypothetical protein
MIQFKSYDQLSFEPLGICSVIGCDVDGEKLFSTEIKVLDVCLNHYTQLQKSRE